MNENKPPPWKSGTLIYNRKLNLTARYKGNGGWVVGEGREIIHCIPLEEDELAPHGLYYWDRADCEVRNEVKLTVVKGGKR